MKAFLLVVLAIALFSMSCSAGSSCTLCQLAIEFAEEQANATNTATIDAAILKACSHLGTQVTAWCQSNLVPVVPTVINAILARVPPLTVCARLGMCTPRPPANEFELENDEEYQDDEEVVDEESGEQMFPRPPIMPGKPNRLSCSACQGIVARTEQTVGANKSLSNVLRIAKALCAQDGSQAAWCKMSLLPRFPSMLKGIQQQQDPQQICQKARFCNSTLPGNQKQPIHNEEDEEDEEEDQEEIDDVEEQSESAQFADKCAGCMAVIDLTKTTLAGMSPDAVTNAIRAVCRTLGSFGTQGSCDLLVTAIPKIAGDIIRGANSADICKKVQLCK